MSWSYSGDPSSSDVDEVRFHVQDTDPEDKLVSDEEITYLVDYWFPVYGSNLYAAAMVAESIAAKFARDVTVSADGVSTGTGELAQRYNDLAMSLRDAFKSKNGGGGGPFATGTVFDQYFDSSIKPLSFGKGIHDNARAGRQDYGGAGATRPDFDGIFG